MQPAAAGLFDDDELESEHGILLEAISKGHLIPVLGGDINLCGRPLENGTPVPWTTPVDGTYYPPTTCELATTLLQLAQKDDSLEPEIRDLLTSYLPARLNSLEDAMSAVGLANVCQYVQFASQSILNTKLPNLLKREYRPTPVHEFLVKLAQYEPPEDLPKNRPYPVIVTACFDQVLEQQLRKRGVPFHLVSFVLGDNGGVFEYTRPNETTATREADSEKIGEMMDENKKHAVVIKLNGATSSAERTFPVTEDNYIDYLSHQGVKGLLPKVLVAKITKRGRSDSSHLLFLGYSPRHWNLRVILQRIWSENLNNPTKRWTVVLDKKSGQIDKKFWDQYSLMAGDIQKVPSLQTYITKLSERMDTQLPRPKPPAEDAPGGGEVKPTRNGVFISYSHANSVAFEKLLTMLAPVRTRLNIWTDRDIQPGAKWRDEIKSSLARAKVAVLLVSPEFLSSEFIQTEELPNLLEAASTGGCCITWALLSPCMVKMTKIYEFQALAGAKPIMNLPDSDQTDALFCKVAEEITNIALSEKAGA